MTEDASTPGPACAECVAEAEAGRALDDFLAQLDNGPALDELLAKLDNGPALEDLFADPGPPFHEPVQLPCGHLAPPRSGPS